MRILLAQIDPTVGDIPNNLQKILQALDYAKEHKVQLIVFPEMALVGYPPEDLVLLPHFIDAIDQALQTIIKASKGMAVIVGLVRRNISRGEKSLRNSAAIIEDGTLLGFQDKMLLPTYDVFDERRFFEPAHETTLWNIAGKAVAVTICEDIWQHSDLLKYADYPRDPIQELSALHPDLAVNLSASPYDINQSMNRLQVCQRAASALHCPLLLCNQVGGNDSLIFDGHSLYVDGHGELIDYAKGFEEDYLVVDLEKKRKPKNFISQPIEDIYNALVLGIRDYFRKQGFTKACLGLSGGVDSALVACLAVEALGKENVLGVLMPSRYSSEGSVTDARQLAKTLGIKTYDLPIEGPFQNFLSLLGPVFTGHPQEVTEENLQARIRGMLLMALSNKFGYIVLSTGNKSEMAMGYATLYGDMCGGLGVISDVSKKQVYALSKWINRDGEIIPWSTIHKPPSAELRPNQKDSDSLPDYDIVDNVLQAYIEEHQSPQAIAKRFGYSMELVNDLIKRIHRNEYKRRQAPPGLRITQKAFSTGRRFPIVQRFCL